MQHDVRDAAPAHHHVHSALRDTLDDALRVLLLALRVVQKVTRVLYQNSPFRVRLVTIHRASVHSDSRRTATSYHTLSVSIYQ